MRRGTVDPPSRHKKRGRNDSNPIASPVRIGSGVNYEPCQESPLPEQDEHYVRRVRLPRRRGATFAMALSIPVSVKDEIVGSARTRGYSLMCPFSNVCMR